MNIVEIIKEIRKIKNKKDKFIHKSAYTEDNVIEIEPDIEGFDGTVDEQNSINITRNKLNTTELSIKSNTILSARKEKRKKNLRIKNRN